MKVSLTEIQLIEEFRKRSWFQAGRLQNLILDILNVQTQGLLKYSSYPLQLTHLNCTNINYINRLKKKHLERYMI